ncbi:Hira-domain-containing protein [Metschnikowia bicuspidata var. bicuspidata NRRL YB-4993]|uniref:Protein HIR n=1 Tax=Metschnikowia bicuspidata var. bicuspidata NRRL YB-4993 TaxID=869754 RepID=A0A1A0HKU1_9ASCO|nr:Hira-domain-containing protein [Metschnikowia bicuspidata var. bicuspidata NRRL YB-4993]OBA24512.1 Hira-domain-containing protein [Metschnikowia bicuspidata var. bicuspidata NRRL YB-4993]
MRLLVLPQEFHNGEVHTVDINLENALVATGGIDQKVSVWRLEQFTDSINKEPPNLTEIEPQKTIDCHHATVNFVKWSPTNGNQMISADENGTIVKTDLDVDKCETIFPTPYLKRLQKSTALDGCWSIDGRLFAWSTADGAVHIYDGVRETHQFLIPQADISAEKKATLQRSVTFDPNGKYLVTLGDDTMVTVYQYEYDKNNDYRFQVANRVSKLMSNTVTKSSGANYRRISWSCDGEFFAVPNATKQLTSVVSLLSASLGWDNNISLVGHDMECDLVKFAPHIYQRKSKSEPASIDSDLEILDFEVYHIIATAGSDSSLVLWNTTKETPLFVMHNISPKPLVDLVWDKTGSIVLMSTLDGKVIIAGFSEEELGQKSSSEFLKKIKASQNLAKKQSLNKSSSETHGAKKSKVPLESISQKDAIGVRDELIISDQNDELVLADPNNSLVTSISQPSEVVPQVLAPGLQLMSYPENDLMSRIEERKPTVTPKNQEQSPKVGTLNPSSVPKVTLKNGKKRIQPTTLSNGTTNSVTQRMSAKDVTSVEVTKMGMEFDRPSYTVSEEMIKDNKRQKTSDDSHLKKKPKRELEPVKFIGSVVANLATTFAQVRLSAPKIRSAFRVSDTSYTLDIKNGLGNESAPSRVTCLKNESQVWSDFIPQFVQLATRGNFFWALCTADGTIHTYSSTSGKRLFPPIIMGSPISFLESKNQYLMVVTSIAEILVWDLDKKKIHMKSPLSLAALLDLNSKLQENTLSKSDNITMCSITSKGFPVTTLSNGSGYIYNIDMEVWQTVTEAWWAFGSHYWDSITDDKVSPVSDSPRTIGEREGSSLISMLEHKTNEELLRKSRTGRGKYFNKISKNMMMKEGFENLENTVSLSHLENRILCSELLEELEDFKDFLITYSNRLCELGLQAKLFEMFETVLGEQDQLADTDKSVNSRICGLNRHDLLKDIILSCAEHRDVQRILVYFGTKIGLISRDYE